MSSDGNIVRRHPRVLDASNGVVRCLLKSDVDEATAYRSDGSRFCLRRGQEFSQPAFADISDSPSPRYQVESIMSSLVLAKCVAGGYELHAAVRGGESDLNVYEVQPDDYRIFLNWMVADLVPVEES